MGLQFTIQKVKIKVTDFAVGNGNGGGEQGVVQRAIQNQVVVSRPAQGEPRENPFADFLYGDVLRVGNQLAGAAVQIQRSVHRKGARGVGQMQILERNFLVLGQV